MKILKDPKYLFFSILLLFSVINVLQSHFTNLFQDEAYYYVWSKDLAFGYFDHPPMVAIWGAIGNQFATGELGLRILSTISFSAMLWLIWLMVDAKEKWQHVFTLFYSSSFNGVMAGFWFYHDARYTFTLLFCPVLTGL